MRISKPSVLWVLALSLLAGAPAQADFVSPFPSTVDGIDVPNTHLLAGSLEPGASAVLRGMAPRDLLPQLLENGITDFVIFKNETHTEVRDQIRELLDLGFDDADNDESFDHDVNGDGVSDMIHPFPFRWKGFGDAEFTESCEMTLDALKVLFDVLDTPGRKAFFHCTVGEDRTGMLAGLFRSLNEEVVPGKKKQWSIRGAFYWEMCEGGYAAGNPEKAESSPFVVREIDKAITPFYVKMGYLIEKGLLTKDNVGDKSICRRDPKFDPELRHEFRSSDRYNHYKYRCRTSTRYPFNL